MEKNRSVIFFHNKVLKIYSETDWYIAEKKAYRKLHEFNDLSISDGWLIKTPLIYLFDHINCSIMMEKLAGADLLTIAANRKRGSNINWYMIGMAIARFHNEILCKYNEERVYSDIGLGNILVSEESKSIGLIDPGINFMEKKPFLQDVVMVLWAIQSLSLKYLKFWTGAEKNFLRGYLKIIVKPKDNLYFCKEKVMNSLLMVNEKLSPRMKKKGFILLMIYNVVYRIFSMRVRTILIRRA